MTFSDFVEYIPASLILLTSVIGGTALWIQTLADDFVDKKKIIARTGFAILLSGVISAGASYYSTAKSNLEQAKLQYSLDSTARMAKNGVELSGQIKALQEINNKLADQTKSLTSATKDIVVESNMLTAKNVSISNTIASTVTTVETVATNIKNITDTIYGQQTGGNSIPAVYSKVTYFGCDWWDFNDPTDPNCEHYVLNIFIKNIGIYPLNNVKYTLREIKPDYDKDTVFEIKSLNPSELDTFGITYVLGDKIQIKTENYALYAWTVDVEWRTKYTYTVFFEWDSEKRKVKLDEVYTFRGISYRDKKMFQESIEKELKQKLYKIPSK